MSAEARLKERLESDLLWQGSSLPGMEDHLRQGAQSHQPFHDGGASQVCRPQHLIHDFGRCRNFDFMGLSGIGMRREGIYHSLLSKWRQQRAEGIELGLSEKARGVKGPSVKTLQEENRKLQRQKARLEEELRRARIIIEFQKKAAALFEPTTETEES